MKNLKIFNSLIIGAALVLGCAFVYGAVLSAVTTLSLIACMSIVTVLFFAAAVGSVKNNLLFEGMGQVGARMVYENALNTLSKLRDPNTGLAYDVSSAIPTSSFIRGEVLLEVGKSTYDIPLITSQPVGPVRSLNKVINLQDIFISNSISMFFTIGSPTDTAAKAYTYPNATVFSTSGAAAALWNFYNGELQLLNNNVQVMPAWDLLKHYCAPQIQQLAALYYASSPTQADSTNFATDGFYPCESGLVINGAANMKMQIVLKGGPAAIQSTSNVVIMQRGILFQNVSSVK
jgi:hypothetical protein